MKKFFNILVQIILYIWQFPQNLVGIILKTIMRPDIKTVKRFKDDVNVYVSSRMSGGISLGKYIILSKYNESLEMHSNTWNHEYGHTRQSKMLGPLYLIVIGLPSLCWAGIYGTKLHPATRNGYYVFYTERWADKLGGVKRI